MIQKVAGKLFADQQIEFYPPYSFQHGLYYILHINNMVNINHNSILFLIFIHTFLNKKNFRTT